MTKYSAKDAIILIGGYNLSTYATAFETEANMNPVDTTGFTDGSKNFIPGLPSARITADMFWSSTSGATHTALATLGSSGNVTILPRGYALGNESISMPYYQANYAPKGTPDSALSIGSIEFASRGNNEGVEHGYVLAHASVSGATTTGVGYQVNAAPVTARCAGTLHVWTAPASETTVVKIQHCTTLNGVYADLITFTINGSALTSERVAVASGTINQFIRVLATKSGASQTLGYSVHYWQSV